MAHDWSSLCGLSPTEQIEHLKWLVETMTEPPPEMSGLTLTRVERRVAGLLMHRMGHIVTRESLMAAVYVDRQPEDWGDDAAVKVFICRIRPKLASVGVRVELEWDVGYRAVPA